LKTDQNHDKSTDIYDKPNEIVGHDGVNVGLELARNLSANETLGAGRSGWGLGTASVDAMLRTTGHRRCQPACATATAAIPRRDASASKRRTRLL
jgi:hypothetical protein